MRIAFLEVESWERGVLIGALRDKSEVELYNEKLTSELISSVSDCEIISPFIYSQFTADIINQLPQLKFIATRSTGFDHIDLEACRSKGIQVANVPHYGENTVAEHAFALILALSRKLKPSLERTTRGDFSLDGLRGFDLNGKTLGIAGLGRIGKNTAKIGRGFGMRVLAYDVNQDSEFAKNYQVTYVDLPNLLKESDVISLHLNYTPETHHLINRETLKLMKSGSYLVNTARGGLVETEALLEGLDSGVLAGVGLDVLEEEGLIKEEHELLSTNISRERLQDALCNHILLKDPRVVITPHNAFNSKEALCRILDTTLGNINAYIAGDQKNLVS